MNDNLTLKLKKILIPISKRFPTIIHIHTYIHTYIYIHIYKSHNQENPLFILNNTVQKTSPKGESLSLKHLANSLINNSFPLVEFAIKSLFC